VHPPTHVGGKLTKADSKCGLKRGLSKFWIRSVNTVLYLLKFSFILHTKMTHTGMRSYTHVCACTLRPRHLYSLPIFPGKEEFYWSNHRAHRGRGEIGGMYLPSQLERTPQFCSWSVVCGTFARADVRMHALRCLLGMHSPLPLLAVGRWESAVSESTS
jgi:hypothetical protein